MSPADNVSASAARFTAGRISSRLKRWSSSSQRSPWRRFAPYLGTVLALSLFSGALYLLHRQVAAYDPEDVRKALTALSWQRIVAALGLTGASYALLMFYDALALRHMRKTLPFRRVALASFTSYAFTHSFGFGSLMHATIRYRLYAPLGLRTADIAEITAFVNITFMIGLAIMFPVIALLHASALEGMGLPQATSIAFGAGALALVVAYAALGWWVQRLELFGFVLKVPGPNHHLRPDRLVPGRFGSCRRGLLHVSSGPGCRQLFACAGGFRRRIDGGYHQPCSRRSRRVRDHHPRGPFERSARG